MGQIRVGQRQYLEIKPCLWRKLKREEMFLPTEMREAENNTSHLGEKLPFNPEASEREGSPLPPSRLEEGEWRHKREGGNPLHPRRRGAVWGSGEGKPTIRRNEMWLQTVGREVSAPVPPRLLQSM